MRGGRHMQKVGSELHEEEATFVAGTSKRIHAGHNSCRAAGAEHMEPASSSSAVRGRGRHKEAVGAAPVLGRLRRG